MLPLPLGANKPWAWSVFEFAIFALTIFITVKNRKLPLLGLTSYMSIIYMWLAFITVASLQIIPLPQFVVALLSPTSFDVFTNANADTFYLSVDPGQSTISFIKLLSFFCLLICVLSLINSEHRIRLLLLTMLASGTFQALYGVLEMLLVTETSLVFGLPVNDIATGSFVYNNHFANYLMMCLAAGIGLLVTSLQRSSITPPENSKDSIMQSLLSSKYFIRTCMVIMIVALVMSQSSMGNAAFFLSMAFTGGLAFVLIKNRSRGLSVLIISIFIIDLFIVSAYFGLERVKDRLAQTSSQQENRNEVLTDAYPMIADYPLFGIGGGSFQSTFPSYQETQAKVFYEHLHNDYIQFLIEYGIVGGFILFSIFVFCLYKSARAMRKRRNSIFKGTAFACFMALIGMAVHITLDFPLQAYANACYFVVFLALCMVINKLKIRREIDIKS